MNFGHEHQISKILSENDLGLTGSHQAGMLVPRAESILSFFPRLDSSTLNPRVNMQVVDESERDWRFVFIHYNNRLVAGGTRNEYRLTHMTAFLRKHDARPGDSVSLERVGMLFRVRVQHVNGASHERLDSDVIRLSGNWTVIRLNP